MESEHLQSFSLASIASFLTIIEKTCYDDNMIAVANSRVVLNQHTALGFQAFRLVVTSLAFTYHNHIAQSKALPQLVQKIAI